MTVQERFLNTSLCSLQQLSPMFHNWKIVLLPSLLMNKKINSTRIPGIVLRGCISRVLWDQLAKVFTFIFNLSLSTCTVHKCLKSGTIKPIPQKSVVWKAGTQPHTVEVSLPLHWTSTSFPIRQTGQLQRPSTQLCTVHWPTLNTLRLCKTAVHGFLLCFRWHHPWKTGV